MFWLYFFCAFVPSGAGTFFGQGGQKIQSISFVLPKNGQTLYQLVISMEAGFYTISNQLI